MQAAFETFGRGETCITKTNFLVFHQVPYEILNKKFRTAQKTLDREVSHVQQGVNELEKCLQEGDVKAIEISNLLGTAAPIVSNFLPKYGLFSDSRRDGGQTSSVETQSRGKHFGGTGGYQCMQASLGPFERTCHYRGKQLRFHRYRFTN